MKTVRVCLDSIDKVKGFVNDISRFNTDFDLISGRYVIDAKSIMGIFSLDLSKPIELTIHESDEIDEILKLFSIRCRLGHHMILRAADYQQSFFV